LGVHESPCGRVWNVDELTLILGIEDRNSRTSERALNLGYAGRFLRGCRLIRSCNQRECEEPVSEGEGSVREAERMLHSTSNVPRRIETPHRIKRRAESQIF